MKADGEFKVCYFTPDKSAGENLVRFTDNFDGELYSPCVSDPSLEIWNSDGTNQWGVVRINASIANTFTNPLSSKGGISDGTANSLRFAGCNTYSENVLFTYLNQEKNGVSAGDCREVVIKQDGINGDVPLSAFITNATDAYPGDVPWANTNAYISVRSNGLYNAFPSMVSDGTNGLLVAWSESTAHSKGTGVCYFATMDYAGTLGTPLVMASNDAAVNPNNAVVFRTTSGKLLYAYGLWDPETGGFTVTNNIRLCASTNNGTTWGSPVSPLPAASNFIGNATMFTQIGNRILLNFWSQDATSPTTYASYTIESSDDGETWGDVRTVACEAGNDYDETSIVGTGGSNYLALIRNDYDGYFHIARSTDAAQTWEAVAQSFLGGGRPAMVKMRDGRLICVYRSRSDSKPSCRWSNDNGTTWSAEIAFDATEPSDYMYAGVVEVRDNVLAVLYGIQPGVTATNISWLRLKYIINGIGEGQVYATNHVNIAPIETPITNFSRNADGTVNLKGKARPGTVLWPEYSTNLMSVSGWTALTNMAVHISVNTSNFGGFDGFSFTNVPATNNPMFFRIGCDSYNAGTSNLLANSEFKPTKSSKVAN